MIRTLLTTSLLLPLLLLFVACDSENDEYEGPLDSVILVESPDTAKQTASDDALDVLSLSIREFRHAGIENLTIAPLEPDSESCELDARAISIADGVDSTHSIGSLCLDDMGTEFVLRECRTGEAPIGQAASSVEANQPSTVPVGACYWCESNSFCWNGKPTRREGYTASCPWNWGAQCCWSWNIFAGGCC